MVERFDPSSLRCCILESEKQIDIQPSVLTDDSASAVKDSAEADNPDLHDAALGKQQDLSLVFGPGASSLDLGKGVDQVTNSPKADISATNADSSTPIRQQSRGRRRLRNSDRSSFSSPSPVRPPNFDSDNTKPRFDTDEDEPGGNIKVSEELGNDGWVMLKMLLRMVWSINNQLTLLQGETQIGRLPGFVVFMVSLASLFIHDV